LVQRSIAALAIAEVEPALLRTEIAAAVIEIIADAYSASSLAANSDVASSFIADRGAAKQVVEDQSSVYASSYEATSYKAAGSRSKEHFDRANSADHLRAQTSQADDPGATSSLSQRLTEANEKSKPIDLRERAFTRWGGLLFLFAVFEDLNLLEVIFEHPVLRERPFTWVLHQLALTIAAISPNDPAALAFAGLSPGSEPPSDKTVASECETAVLHELAASMIEHLSSFLVFEDEPPPSLIDFVCRRRAEIIADPGWIEVRFSLDEVSTEIRRAGLDLDPGYMSWLGIVMRFVYE
jgi:hypothetical protein